MFSYTVDTLMVRHEPMCVGVASTSNHIVHPRTVLIETVGNGIVHNRRQRSNVGHVAPQTIASCQVRPVNLSRFTGVKVFVVVVATATQRPAVHVSDLGTMGTDDAKELTGFDFPRASVTRGNHDSMKEGCSLLLDNLA